MKNFFSVLGLITLFVFSFIYTEKTKVVVQEMDDLMIELKSKSTLYEVKPKEANIVKDTIVPGLAGKRVDLNKSYVKMKEYGKFNENLLVYEKTLPKETLPKNTSKFVIRGNKEKRMVSLIFLVEEEDNIDTILSILNKYQTRATFFIDGNWLEKHVEVLDKLIQNHHTIGNLSYQRDYQDSSFVWIDTIIKKIGKQSQSFCYSETKDTKVTDICHLYQDITIIPNIIVEEDPLSEVQQQLSSGSLIALEVNETTEQQLPSMIRYIESRGYELENLQKHIME